MKLPLVDLNRRYLRSPSFQVWLSKGVFVASVLILAPKPLRVSKSADYVVSSRLSSNFRLDTRCFFKSSNFKLIRTTAQRHIFDPKAVSSRNLIYINIRVNLLYNFTTL